MGNRGLEGIDCRIHFFFSSMSKKKLVDVYRHVFGLRHEVFTHRPIADSQGAVSPEDKERFRLQCNGICTTLMMFMCVLQPAIVEESGQLQKALSKNHIC